jgi:uncharacterized protein (DUF2132 family)
MTDEPPRQHPRDPLHGVTLQAIVEDLVARRGWDELGDIIRIRCFTHDPSIGSSLKFLRKTPWARTKVEQLYLADQWDIAHRASEERERRDRDGRG